MSPPVRKGDGTGVVPQEIAEVRTGDGRVLFGGAIPDNVVDDFEEAQYEAENKTLSDYYAGDVGSFSRQQSVVSAGDYALESTALGEIRSTSGLNRYPQSGETFAYNLRLSAESNYPITLFGYQDSDNYYRIDHDVSNSTLSLNKNESGFNELDSVSYTPPTGEFLEIIVDWGSDGTITVTVNDASGSQIAQMSASDSTFTDGGIGWRSVNGETIYFDNHRVV